MAKNNNLTDFLTDIANAIRQKKGTNALINPQNFSSEIASISGGGSTDFTQMDSLLNELEDAFGEYTALQYTAYANPQSGVTYTAVSDLSNYTDEEIEAISKAISNCSGISSSTQTIYLSDETSISVGATRSYTLSSQEQMTDRIIGFNHDDLTSSTAYGEVTSTGKAGITWQTVNCLKDRYIFNSNNGMATNQGGWNASEIRTITIPQIKATLPQTMLSMLKPVNKKAADGGSTNYTQIVTSSDYLFLLSEIEVMGSSSYAQNGADEGSQYKYYVVNNTASDRIKNYDNDGTTMATYWWLRSSNTTTAKVVNISTSGSVGASSSTSTTRGVAFAYCT